MPTLSNRQPVDETSGYVTDEEGNVIPDYEGTIKIFDEGDIVSGKVVRIDRDEILVDIGYKSEGVIPAKELAIRQDVDPNEVLSLGDEIQALVLQKEDKDGRLILSKKRAEYERAWERIETMNRAGENVRGRVIEVVKGGLILDIGLRGFLPASLVDIRRVKDLHEFIGQELECKIIEMDRNRNNVVLSRRAVLEFERKEQREAVLANLEKGQRIKGTVSSVVPFGAFVDLDGIDGLIHISELSWEHVDHPSEILSVADEVEVQVLEVDRSRQRISLGLRQTQDDPWKKMVEDWEIGSVVEGRVTKLVPFGAFVSISNGIEGLVHISEFADTHVATPEEMLSVGETVRVKIIDIDLERRRISLSLRQAREGEEGEEAKPAPKARAKKAKVEAAVEAPAPEAEVALKAAVEVAVVEPQVEAEAAVETPVEAAVEAAVEAPVEAAVETAAVELVVEAAAEPVVEAAAEAVVEAPAEPVVEVAAEAVVEVAAEAVVEVAEAPAQEVEAAPEAAVEASAEEKPKRAGRKKVEESEETAVEAADDSLESVIEAMKKERGPKQ